MSVMNDLEDLRRDNDERLEDLRHELIYWRVLCVVCFFVIVWLAFLR